MKLTMKKFVNNFLFKPWKNGTDIALLIVRVVFGLSLFFGHGLGKLTVIFSGQEIMFMDPIGLGPKFSFYLVAFAEGIASLLLILGLFSRFSAVVLTFNFLVILVLHGIMLGDPFGVFEMPTLYFGVFAAMIFALPGKYSLDYHLFKK